MGMREDLRVTPGGVVDMASWDPGAKPGVPGDKDETKAALDEMGDELASLQDRLYAEGTVDSPRRILIVLQGMDTSGKGGVIKHVAGQVNPLGLEIASFKKPTEEELSHDFLWRIRKRIPQAGNIGIFDRSHYEDVLIGRVRELAPLDEIERRYEQINEFERELTEAGVTLIKCFLHITYDTQRERLLARLDDPTKRWKFNEGDIDERRRWDDYQAAYQIALSRCSTEWAPWYVVPSDRKWARNWVVGNLLLETLREMDPQYPERPDLDDEDLKRRLAPPN
jgi:PPK2 family polyphosphate:nucleotide phosphotransferase